jgi:uncharacterized Zn finger protein (UPF0148 family)
MSSDEEDYDDEQKEQQSDDGIECPTCDGYMRLRDEEAKKRKNTEKALGEQTALAEARGTELRKVKEDHDALTNKINVYKSALSEVLEKMFYCGKDEGSASVRGSKKGTER